MLSGRVMQWFSSRPPTFSLAEQEREVGRQVRLADVLGQPDRADRVEAGLRHVAVVQVPHLGQAGQPLPLDRRLSPGGLLGGQRDPERLDAVLPRRVDHHAAPAAADVEQPHALACSPSLRATRSNLYALRLFQGGVLVGIAGAGVRHRRPEHPLVEPVGDVVVMGDRLGVTALGVQPASQPAAGLRDFLRRRRHPVQQQLRAAEGLQQPQLLRHGHADGLGLGHPGQGLVHVPFDVKVPGHVGPGQAESSRRLGQVGHSRRRADSDLHRRSGRAGMAAVIGHELHRGIAAPRMPRRPPPVPSSLSFLSSDTSVSAYLSVR